MAPGVLNADGVPHVWSTTMSASVDASDAAHTSTTRDLVDGAVNTMPPIYHLIFFANLTGAGYDVPISELHQIERQLLHSYDMRGKFGVAHAPPPPQPTSYIAREYYSSEIRMVNGTTPLHGQPHAPPITCASGGYTPSYCIPFELWSLAPLPASGGWVMLGEAAKYIGVSGQRFQSFATTTAGALMATVQGAPHEDVAVLMLDCRLRPRCLSIATIPRPITVRCSLPASGIARLSCMERCNCQPA